MGRKGMVSFCIQRGGEDIFVHFSAIDSEQPFKVLNQDAEVDFEFDTTQKGLQAKNVRELTEGAGSGGAAPEGTPGI